jgi:hypothetical protein
MSQSVKNSWKPFWAKEGTTSIQTANFIVIVCLASSPDCAVVGTGNFNVCCVGVIKSVSCRWKAECLN